jgi:hypothetical protein
MGGQDATTRGDDLLIDSFGSGDQGVMPLLEGLSVGSQKATMSEGMIQEEDVGG